ncbi:MAG: hypothetical protein B7Y95_13485 [Rhizobiales bacterium 32-66-11]|jgi:hypothetical protein|nr:MAG: hypothetical protein B7Y95_13485 [Rhizobiales bacterium 32-66-11]
MPFCFSSGARRRSTFGLLALVGGAAMLAGAPARAQYYPYPPTVYGAPAEMPRVYRAPPGYSTGTVMLPPQEIRSIVLNLGYGRVGRPVLRGRTYMIDAVDDRGPLILAVDAYSGLVQPADPSMFGPPGGPYGPAPGYGAAPPPGAYGAPPAQGAYGAAPPQGAYGAPPAQGAYGAAPQRAQPVARAPLPKPRPADSDIASTSGPDIAAPAVPPADDGAADDGAADDDARDTAANPGALAVAPSDGANAPKAATPGLASPTPSMSAPVVGQPAPAQAAAANTPIPALPAVPPQGPTGAGTATPGDGVSAGTASVLSRTAPPAK